MYLYILYFVTFYMEKQPVFVYVMVWLAVVFGINSASNAGRKIVIVRGAAEHYYNFHTCIASTINSNYYNKPYCYRLIQYCCC